MEPPFCISTQTAFPSTGDAERMLQTLRLIGAHGWYTALEWIARAAGSVATGIKEGARRAGSPFRGRPAGGSTPGGAKTPGAKTPGAKTPGAKTPMKGPTSAREQSPARGRR